MVHSGMTVFLDDETETGTWRSKRSPGGQRSGAERECLWFLWVEQLVGLDCPEVAGWGGPLFVEMSNATLRQVFQNISPLLTPRGRHAQPPLHKTQPPIARRSAAGLLPQRGGIQ